MTVLPNTPGAAQVSYPYTIMPMIAALAKITPLGTYVDVAGATFVEVPGQVRITLSTLRRQAAGCQWTGHVSANTGSVQFYNVTKAADIFTATCTSVTEVIIGTNVAQLITTTNTTPGDVLTVRTKNSNAGQSQSIDSGGIMSGDSLNVGSGTGGTTTVTGLVSSGITGGVVTKIQMGVLKLGSDATFTLRILQGAAAAAQISYNGVAAGTTGFVPDLAVQLGQTITEASNGLVVARTPKYKALGSGGLFAQWAVTGGTLTGGAGLSFVWAVESMVESL